MNHLSTQLGPILEPNPDVPPGTACPECKQGYGLSHLGTCSRATMRGGSGIVGYRVFVPVVDRTVCVHDDWRLIDAKRANFATYLSEDGKRVKRPVPVVYRWYCTRCRVIEETTE